jgi:hypothetical protein
LDAEMLFNAMDGLGCGRLAHIVDPGTLREALVLNDVAEYA